MSQVPAVGPLKSKPVTLASHHRLRSELEYMVQSEAPSTTRTKDQGVSSPNSFLDFGRGLGIGIDNF